MSIETWIPVRERLPADGERVQWISPCGEVVRGEKGPGKMWFVGDIYVYYEPVFWKPE